MGKIIGLHGRARSGKDTAAHMLKDNFPQYGFVINAFAKSLKSSAANLLDLTVDELETMKNNEDDYSLVLYDLSSYANKRMIVAFSIREFLQRYGTEAHRQVFGQDFWVDQVLPKGSMFLETLKDSHTYLIITDVRFVSEAERILDFGGEVWHIIRDSHSDEIDDSHISEHVLPQDMITRTLYNDGDLIDFEDAVMDAFLQTIAHEKERL